ncbi:MAG: hypothetical protein ABJD07_00585 [Gemmatimonadaceae bacterium]
MQLDLLSLLPHHASRPGPLDAPSQRSAGASHAPPTWDDVPIALGDGGGERKRLRAVSSAAARRRVRIGMTVPEARALCTELDVLDWDDAALGRGLTVVTGTLLAASPQVTPVEGEPGLWWIGAGGMDGRGGEPALARELARLAKTWHPRPRIAIADSCVVARAATWSAGVAASRGGGACWTIIPTGGDAAYLAAAPLALVPMDSELRETLAALGLTRAGALAALSAEDVERRWGAEGLHAWQLARGEDARRPVLARADARRVVDAELPVAATVMEPVLFLVRAALERLADDLACDGRSAAAIAVTLRLDDVRSSLPAGAPAHTVTREARLPRPTARAPQLFEHCRALLERWTQPGDAAGGALAAPVSAVSAAIAATAPSAGEQGDLLATRWRDPAAADAAFARLRSELGPDVVVRPVARDEHRPEGAGAWVEENRCSVIGDRCSDTIPPEGTRRSRNTDVSLRLLEAPEAIEIERVEGVPCGMWWRGARSPIVRAMGPERLSGDWWKDDYRRDYWRCEGETGEFLVFASEDGWWLHGWYD